MSPFASKRARSFPSPIAARWVAVTLSGALLGCGAAVSLLGCGAAAVPQELHNARDAYKRASEGPATQLAPAQLDTARQSLEQADKAQTEGDEPEVVRDLAYVAERQAAIAEASARLEQATRDTERYEKERTDLQRDELANVRQELEKEKAEKQKLAENVQSEREGRLVAEKRAAAALQSLDEVARVKEEARGIVITLSGQVLFATGTYSLLPIAKDKLNDVAKALIEQGDSSIVVEGHTDSRGGDGANQELSLQRAQEVRGYLVSQGVPSDSIRAVGVGESRPIASNASAEGRANNRRVEIVVKPKTARSGS
jgi:outer membrane protein OmpA-like peptidoglycan-associated protein